MSGYAWVTLATNDSYSLGALVLAHSLKKCNTIHKLAILITPAVSQPMREQLQSIFNVVKLVDVLDSKDEAHLALLQRPELGITFTKIHCWNLTEFKKCVFLDADTLVVRNCDELFEREEFSAAPDVSWPDCFNSGVFVYEPSIATFNKILNYAVQKGSFDGGDQGLLNQYFGTWATEDIKKHLPFVYNVTTIAAYSYIPAFKHYGSETRIVHFIGAEKPWLQKLDPTTKKVSPSSGSEHLTPLLQKWWDLFSENVHPKLDKSLSGIAGTIAQLNFDSESSKASLSAYQEYIRRQNWEAGNMDYMGKDSFDNIWSKICENINKKAIEDPKGNMEVLKQSKPEKQKESGEKISEGVPKEISSNLEKPTTGSKPEEIRTVQTVPSDKQVPLKQTPVVQQTTASPKEPAAIVSSNISGNDAKLAGCESPLLSKTPNLPVDSKIAPTVPVPEAQIPQPITPIADKTSKPPLITETPATPISEKKADDEPKLLPAAQQKEPQKEVPVNTAPLADIKKVSPEAQTQVQSKQDVTASSPNLQTSNVSAVPVAPTLNTNLISSSQITPTTPTPESKTKEPLVFTPTTAPPTTPPTTPAPILPQAETKSKEPITSTSPTSSVPASIPLSNITMTSPAEDKAAGTPPVEQIISNLTPQQITTSTTNLEAKVQPIIPPLAAVGDNSKTLPPSEPKLEPKPQPQATAATESSPANKSSSETIKEECNVKLSDILQPKGPPQNELKDKPQAHTQEQDKNTAVVPYCDVLKQAQGTQEKEKEAEKEKPRSQKSIEELKKRQSEIKTSQLPPIPLPDNPVQTQPDCSQKEEKNKSQPASQQVTSEESKDPNLKTLSEGSLKDNGKQKKGVFSKILEIVGVSPKEKKEDETENSKSVFYDCEGIPSAEKKQDLITNESSVKTVSEVPEKPVADTSKTQGEKTSTKANEEGVRTSKSPQDEAKTTNIDKSKDVNFDKKKTSNMLQSETPSDGGNKQDKQKAKETQPKQEDSQSGSKKNKAKSKPPRNTAPTPPTKIEETKQSDNKDKKKESPNPDSLKGTQKQETLSKTAEVLSTPLTEPKEAKDNSSKPQKPESVPAAESKVKENLETKLPNEGNIKSDLVEILNKAKTEVETRMQEKKQEGGEGLVPEAGEEVNTMKLIVGETNKTENQTAGKKDAKNVQQNKQKPQKDGKLNKRGPLGQAPPPSAKMEEIEEVKVTSEEDRKKHKGQVPSSKLSDQILKAIPPPRRKAISDSKAEMQDSNATASDKTPSEVTVPAAQQQPQTNNASGNAKSQPQQPHPDSTSGNAKPQLQQQCQADGAAEKAKPQPDAAKPANTAAGGKTGNATENTKPTNANQKGEGKTKSASGPVPPPRNRSKPRQPTPPKSKSKK